MARIAGSHGPTTAAAIRRAGLALIHRHGYEATSLRQLAAAVGLRPASLYNHFPTKQALLFSLIHDHMIDLLAGTEAALEAAGRGPLARLRAFLAHHLRYHLDRKAEVFIANFELRALAPGNHAAVIGLRRRYEGLLIGLLEEEAAAGRINLPDAPVTAYAVLAMLTGACTWYKPEGRLDPEAIIALHTDLVLRGLAAAAPPLARAASGPE